MKALNEIRFHDPGISPAGLAGEAEAVLSEIGIGGNGSETSENIYKEVENLIYKELDLIN